MRLPRLAIGLVVLMVAAGCSVGPSGLSADGVASRRIPVEPADYAAVAWLPSGWIVVNWRPGSERITALERLWRLRPDGSEFGPVKLVANPECRRVHYHAPTTLPDGRLGFLKDCDSFQVNERSAFWLIGSEADGSDAMPLMDGPLGYSLSSFTWNPQITEGLFSIGSGICSGIARMTRGGVEDFPITVGDGNHRFRVDADIRDPSDSDCWNEGQAGSPIWSPDGSRIAFLASPLAVGVEGFNRAYLPWNLYLMDAEGSQARAALSDISSAGGIAWRPQGDWIALIGDPPGYGDGLWLYSLGQGTLRRVTDDPPIGFAWSSDGTEIVGIHVVEQGVAELRSELLVWDVQDLLRR